jgi:subtilisin family serine protease
MAPGVNIFSTYINGTYKVLSGTSMASPHVVGVAAQVWAVDLTKSNDYVRGLLKSTAENLGLLAVQQGAGLVRADLATNATSISEPPPPPPPPVVTDPIVTVSSDKTYYSGNVWANIKVGVTDGDQPIAGASVRLMVTTPDLVKTFYSGTTDSLGQVVFKYRLLKTSAKGEYKAEAYYDWTGGEATDSTSFTYN